MRALPTLLTCLALLGALAAPAHAATLPPGITEEAVRVGGILRTYYIHVPDQLQGQTGVPAVFVFHGGQGTGLDAADASQMAPAGDAANFIAVFPNATTQWNDGRSTTADGPDDVAFVQALIAKITQDHGVDPGRVFATGVSNGGMFTQRLACDAAGSFRAFGVVAAYLPVDYQAACKPGRPVPIAFFNGTTDPMMPWDGGAITQSAGGNLGEGGNVLSHSATMAFWSQNNACQTLAGPTDWPDQFKDGTSVTSEGLSNCTAGVTMDIYIINHGGHTWPGSGKPPSSIVGLTSAEVSATNQFVAFFQKYGL